MSATTRTTKKKAEQDQSQPQQASGKQAGTPENSSPSQTIGVAESNPQDATVALLRELTRNAPWHAAAAALANRKEPRPLHKLLPRAERCPLAWSTGPRTSAAAIQLIDWLCPLRRRARDEDQPSDWEVVADEWLTALATREATCDLSLEAIAWVHALPRLAVRLSSTTWARLTVRLIELASSVPPVETLEGAEPHVLLLTQLMAGELPLSLAYVLPEIGATRALRQAARDTLSAGLLASLDGEGVPHARLVKWWRMLLACWTRSVAIDAQCPGKRITKEARLQFEWLVRQSLRVARCDGTLIFSDDRSNGDQLQGLLRSALEVGGDRVDRELWEVRRGRKNAAASVYELPMAGEHSEWAELAVLRANWTARSPYWAATFSQGAYFSEVAVGTHRLWCGPTMPEVRVDGAALDPQGDWEELCWLSDHDVDFIELEIELTHGWRLQRQMLLARRDEFLYLADVVLGPHSGAIDYRLELPLDPQLTPRRQPETSEVAWFADRQMAWAIPLGLSEWTIDSRQGRFDGRVLYQTAHAAALYVPLFVDLSPKRHNKARTWRQLTVGENLEILPRDVAVAYRVQVGARQWVIYRALTKTGNRTFLGQNVVSEFLISRFDPETGEIEDLIEIE